MSMVAKMKEICSEKNDDVVKKRATLAVRRFAVELGRDTDVAQALVLLDQRLDPARRTLIKP